MPQRSPGPRLARGNPPHAAPVQGQQEGTEGTVGDALHIPRALGPGPPVANRPVLIDEPDLARLVHDRQHRAQPRVEDHAARFVPQVQDAQEGEGPRVLPTAGRPHHVHLARALMSQPQGIGAIGRGNPGQTFEPLATAGDLRTQAVSAHALAVAVQAHDLAAVFQQHQQSGGSGGAQSLQIATACQSRARPAAAGGRLHERGHADHPAIIVEADQGGGQAFAPVAGRPVQFAEGKPVAFDVLNHAGFNDRG